MAKHAVNHHEQNKRGALGPLDKNKYLAMRDELDLVNFQAGLRGAAFFTPSAGGSSARKWMLSARVTSRRGRNARWFMARFRWAVARPGPPPATRPGRW